MDSRSPKRRKITSDSPSKSTSRPSYRAPTRASLSRSNPDLLPPPRSSPRKSPRRPADDVLSHVLGAKARRKSMPAPALRASPVLGADVATAADDAMVTEGVEGQDEATAASTTQHETPTIEGGRYREGELDDLPETPQHLRDNPDYQDTPPKGVLSGSSRRRRSKTGKSPLAKSPAANLSVSKKRRAPEGQIEKPQPELSMEERMRLKARREESSSLKEEMRKLRQENKEIERHVKALRSLKTDEEYAELADLVTIINRLQPEHDDAPPASQPSVSDRLMSFLPCSIPVQRPADTEDTEPVPSHAPLPDTTQLLNLFTPFQVSSDLSIPSAPSEAKPTITQTNTINLAIPGFLSCTLALTTTLDPSTTDPPSIDSLELKYLSPSVEREVGTWIRKRIAERDVQGIGYGLGRFWETNVKRAHVFSQLSQQDAHLKTAVIVAQDRSDNNMAQDNEQRDDVMSMLGRDAFICSDDVYEMMVRWQLSVDTIGDVESKVSLRISCLRKADGTTQKKVADLARKSFKALLSKHGVSVATLQVMNAIFT